MSVIAGVLVTAAVTPVVALSGITASSAVDIFEKLPGHLNPGQLAEPSTIYAKASDGSDVELATFYDQDRKPAKWDDISQYVKDAAVAEEDPRFYTHGGVDALATARAVLQNATGSGFSGASTITMQYVRNVLIQDAMAIPDKDERDAAYKDATRQDTDRKLKEMRLALSIEKKYSKDEILLGYLNIALFGRQVYGIESAANYFYGKSSKDLTLAEAASLVAIVNNPSKLQIDIPENIPANQERRNKILGSMLNHGKITQAQYDEAVATPVTPNITPRVQGCAVAEQNYGLGNFCDYVQLYIQHDPNFGDTAEERRFNFARGGFKIYTTIDLDIQAAGLAAIRETVPAVLDGIDPGGASVSTEVNTGRILAMVQNKPFSNDPDVIAANPGYTAINYNTDYEYGGSSGFQVGSTFKSVTLAEWIRTGHSVRDIVNVNGRSVNSNTFRASCMPGGVYGYDTWTFSNDNLGTRGNQPVLTAIAQSVNGGLVSMQQKMDLCDTMRMAEKLGIHRASDQPVWTQEEADQGAVSQDLVGQQKNPTLNGKPRDLTMVPSNVYGGIDEISPLTMALAYGAFAGNGTVCTPVPIDNITGPDGQPVAFQKAKCTEAISPDVAAGVAYALQYNVQNGLGRHARSALGIPHIAKTGTSDDVVDNWTVGGSSRVTTATWVGNAVGKVSTMRFGNLMYADQTIWPAMMNVADSKYGGEAFPEPNSAATKQTMVGIPDLTGKSFQEASDMLTQLGFSPADGGEVVSSQPQGSVARTDPAGGNEAPLGSSVTIYRSNGQGVKVPDGLVGLTGKQAESAVKDAGLDPKLTCSAGNKPPKDSKVTATSPDGGTEVDSGSEVTLTLDCS